MIRSVKHLKAFDIQATDGSIGSIEDLYFDDERWTIRYVVADTGKWLPGRRVLISPYSVNHLEWGNQRMALSISREQVKGSPDIHTDKPVSRQHEADYLSYYGYPYYWGHAALWGAFPQPMLPPRGEIAVANAEARAAEGTAEGDSHLRSIAEVTGYLVRATDGELGHIDDFLNISRYEVLNGQRRELVRGDVRQRPILNHSLDGFAKVGTGDLVSGR